MILPLKGCYVTSPYGIVRSNGKVHTGIDFISKCKDREVRAIKDGIYRGKFWDAYGYGNYVVVEHDDGIKALYCHLKSAEVISVGTKVKEGQILGIEGTTGNSTGIHLHLEIRENPYTSKFHKNIAEYLGIENKEGYVKFVKEEGEIEMRYNVIEEIPEYAKLTIQKLIDKGIIKGKNNGLDLSEDMIRTFVILDRAGVFDSKDTSQ